MENEELSMDDLKLTEKTPLLNSKKVEEAELEKELRHLEENSPTMGHIRSSKSMILFASIIVVCYFTFCIVF